MPELPDITAYNEALERVFGGHTLRRVRLASPFVLRTVQPRPSELEGKALLGTRRIGKRIVLVFPDEYFLVIHLMISGRFKLAKPDAPVPGKVGLAAFDWVDAPTLIFTEASSKKRASIHVVRGEADLAALDPGGLEPLGSTLADFAAALRSESRTLKRALTDPHILSGIGNAYSDEILHRAQMSPLKITAKMDDVEMERLHAATEDDAARVDGALQRRSCEGLPGEGDRVPSGDGGARQVRPALSALRQQGAAHRLRRQRGELLRHLPDRRQAAGGSLDVAAPGEGLAQVARGAGGETGVAGGGPDSC